MRIFRKFLTQIRNALRYNYSNGLLECLNKPIKVFKRNFYHFKRRILILPGKTFFSK
ncbi:transposase [Enterococcus hirae]|nr:transposase [Enterococcus hirae]